MQYSNHRYFLRWKLGFDKYLYVRLALLDVRRSARELVAVFTRVGARGASIRSMLIVCAGRFCIALNVTIVQRMNLVPRANLGAKGMLHVCTDTPWDRRTRRTDTSDSEMRSRFLNFCKRRTKPVGHILCTCTLSIQVMISSKPNTTIWGRTTLRAHHSGTLHNIFSTYTAREIEVVSGLPRQVCDAWVVFFITSVYRVCLKWMRCA